jgi:hypothetical protein
MSKPIQRRVLEWVLNGETGVSSEAIACAMLGIPRDVTSHHAPSDADDFDCCHELLELIPEWRPILSKVARVYPDWKPFIDRWPEMTKLLERGTALHLNKLEQLLDAAREEAEDIEAAKE